MRVSTLGTLTIFLKHNFQLGHGPSTTTYNYKSLSHQVQKQNLYIGFFYMDRMDCLSVHLIIEKLKSAGFMSKGNDKTEDHTYSELMGISKKGCMC